MKTEIKDKVLSREEIYHLAQAINYLTEALKERAEICFVDHLNRAESEIAKLIGCSRKEIELTEEQCNLGQCVHTWMRKYWDEPLANVLWSMVNSGKSALAWSHFLKNLDEHKLNRVKAFREIDDRNFSSNDRMLLDLLKTWPDDNFIEMIAFYKENCTND